MLRDILRPTAVLVAICAAVTAALAFTYSITKEPIAQRACEEAEEARKKVLCDADRFEEVENLDRLREENPALGAVIQASIGYSEDSAVGHVISLVVKGYGGDMHMTVGIDISGKITGVAVGENSETPGLGSKATGELFLSRLEGITPREELKVVKTGGQKPEEIDAISGATITSRAIVAGVQEAVNAAGLLRQEVEQR